MELVQTPPWGHWAVWCHSHLPKDGGLGREVLLTWGEGAMNISGHGSPVERDPELTAASGCSTSTRCRPSSSARSPLFPTDRNGAAQ